MGSSLNISQMPLPRDAACCGCTDESGKKAGPCEEVAQQSSGAPCVSGPVQSPRHARSLCGGDVSGRGCHLAHIRMTVTLGMEPSTVLCGAALLTCVALPLRSLPSVP